MKNKILLFMLFILSSVSLSQVQNIDTETARGIEPSSVQKTPLLEALYEEAKQLQENPQTTVQEMELNRLAIKIAWAEVNPGIAALYKPVDNDGKLPEIEENMAINGVFVPAQIKQRQEPVSTKDWATDKLLLDDWVDGGIDMEVTHQGHIYISHYKNDIAFGGPFDIIYIHRSLDGGNTFELWKTANITSPITRAKLISIDGSGSTWNYINIYFLTETNNFQMLKWGLEDNSFEATTIASNVNYFDVDRNYNSNTDLQRVFAVYDKLNSGGCHRLYSARTTNGTYGFNWVDEATVQNTCSVDVSVAYGHNGSIYTSHLGQNVNVLYYNANNNYNDPASWSPRLTVEDNPNFNTKEATIIAERNAAPNDLVNIITNTEISGENYTQAYWVENNVLTLDDIVLYGASDFEFRLPDLWIKRQSGHTEISISVGVDEFGANNKVYVLKLGSEGQVISDSGNNVFPGISTAVAETLDGLPCVAFSGTSGTYGRGLYFDAETELLNTESVENNEVILYPNPAMDKITIQATNLIDTIEIINNLGQKIRHLNPENNLVEIDVTGIQVGIYFLKIISDNFTTTKKFQKK